MIDELCQKIFQYGMIVGFITLSLSACILVYNCCKRAKQMYLDSLSPQERHELEERRRQRAEHTHRSKDTDWLSLLSIWSIWFK